jgi:hypothetical protein
MVPSASHEGVVILSRVPITKRRSSRPAPLPRRCAHVRGSFWYSATVSDSKGPTVCAAVACRNQTDQRSNNRDVPNFMAPPHKFVLFRPMLARRAPPCFAKKARISGPERDHSFHSARPTATVYPDRVPRRPVRTVPLRIALGHVLSLTALRGNSHQAVASNPLQPPLFAARLLFILAFTSLLRRVPSLKFGTLIIPVGSHTERSFCPQATIH